jgi:MYXO-CTERM domain-containing protein
MDYYWYGGFFWPHVLASLYAGEDEKAVFVRRIWEGAMQESGGYENTVNYMEALDTLLRERETDLNTAHENYAVQRTLIGEWAGSPLAKVQWADRYNTIPPLAGSLIVSERGQIGAPAGRLPEPFGTNYWELAWPTGYTREIRLTLTSQSPGPWSLVLFHPRWTTVHTARFEDTVAELTFTPTPGQRPRLAVVRGGTDSFDPEMVGPGADYRLDYGPLVPDPIVDEVSPFEHLQGVPGQVTIRGLHFQEGAAVTFLPESVEVTGVQYVGENELIASIKVPLNAPLGVYQVRVANPDGGLHTLERAIFIKPAPEKPTLDGDGCTSAPTGSSSAPGPWLLLGLIGLVGMIRRIRGV